MLALAAAAGLLGLTAAQPASAWDKRGHDLVADLAYQRLSPTARAEVNKLLTYAAQQGSPGCPVTNLHQAAEWPDCIRKNEPALEKQMHLHHGTHIPLCGPIDPASFCKDGRCNPDDIERELPILSNRSANPVDRLHALEAVVHLVGDEHQPLHASKPWGGKEFPVSYAGQQKPETLHHFWDWAIVNAALPKNSDALATLNAEIARNGNGAAWRSGTPMDWTIEANGLARKYAFGELPQPIGCESPKSPVNRTLTPAYFQQMEPIVRLQLERAGVRLAVVLNRALG